MKTRSPLRYLLAASLLFACAMPASAQRFPGAPGGAPPPRTVTTPVQTAPARTEASRAAARAERANFQAGLGGGNNCASPSRPSCDSGDSAGHYSPGGNFYTPNGFPQYPGPNVPLPTPGTYYANPYDYYDNYNPNNPYGYYQNGGYYNPGYYSSGYYNSGFNSGYYNSGPTYNQGNTAGGTGYPSFQGYNTGGGRRR